MTGEQACTGFVKTGLQISQRPDDSVRLYMPPLFIWQRS